MTEAPSDQPKPNSRRKYAGLKPVIPSRARARRKSWVVRSARVRSPINQEANGNYAFFPNGVVLGVSRLVTLNILPPIYRLYNAHTREEDVNKNLFIANL